jgi:PIN domain nuclease of toxin-antitoxin system
MIDIGVDEWLDSIDLDWPDNKDPADRVIIAFGAKKQIPIVTNDQKIKNFYGNVIW